MVSTAIAVVAAIAAAAMFGVSSVLMFRAANTTGKDRHPGGSLRSVLAVRRSPLWLAGAGLQAASFGVQAVALAFGPLALVQPVAATDLLFALPLLARTQARRLQRREWSAALLVTAGVGVFLGVSPPRAGTPTADPHEWSVTVLAVAAVCATALVASRRASRVARTTLLALAGAACFGLVDALSKNFVGHLRHAGVVTTMTSWDPYALAVAGAAGLVLSQLTFQSGALQISLPVIDTLEPTSAVLIGTVVLHEALAASPVQLSVQLAGALVAVVGIVALDRASISGASLGPVASTASTAQGIGARRAADDAS